MNRRSALFAGLLSFLATSKGLAEVSKPFPPVPNWRPSFSEPLDKVADRLRYYTDEKRDFVVFENGTCAIINDGLSDQAAAAAATKTLSKIFHFHPDMNPLNMDDGNVLVRYNHPAVNVVLADIAFNHWAEIEARHQDGLTPDEVLITPLGQMYLTTSGRKPFSAGATCLWMPKHRRSFGSSGENASFVGGRLPRSRPLQPACTYRPLNRGLRRSKNAATPSL